MKKIREQARKFTDSELRESVMGVVKVLARVEDDDICESEVNTFVSNYLNETDCSKRYALFRELVLDLRKRKPRYVLE